MSGRGGRGGGGGGGGRISSTFTHEQLQGLGCIGNKDLSNSNTMNNTPPPIYPVLQSRPLPLETGPARDFKIQWKEKFMGNIMQKKIQSKYQINEFLWDLIPNELRPNLKRKQINKNNTTDITNKKKIHLNSTINIEEKFNVLEAEEQKIRIKDEPNIKEEKQTDDDDDEGVDENDERRKQRQQQKQQQEQQTAGELEEDEIDEEMDEDNDYGFSYFDNGDAYINDEDDNLDDGPIY